MHNKKLLLIKCCRGNPSNCRLHNVFILVSNGPVFCFHQSCILSKCNNRVIQRGKQNKAKQERETFKNHFFCFPTMNSTLLFDNGNDARHILRTDVFQALFLIIIKSYSRDHEFISLTCRKTGSNLINLSKGIAMKVFVDCDKSKLHIKDLQFVKLHASF